MFALNIISWKKNFYSFKLLFSLMSAPHSPGFWGFFSARKHLYILYSKRWRTSCWQWRKDSWKPRLATKKQGRISWDKCEEKRKSTCEEKKKQAKLWWFFIAVIYYLQKTLPLGDKLLISAGCLHPENRKNEYIMKNIEYLAKCFPHFVQESEVSVVSHEWKLYQAKGEKTWQGKMSESITIGRMCLNWRHCMVLASIHYWIS